VIAIVNTAGDSQGICSYEVRINQEVITKFYHDRRDGLEECLLKAAAAVKLQLDSDEINKILKIQDFMLHG